MPEGRYGQLNISVPGTEPYSFTPGHNGCDYGTYLHCGFIPSLGASIAFGMNRDQAIVDPNSSTVLGESGKELFCMGFRSVYKLLFENTTAPFDIDAAFACQANSPW